MKAFISFLICLLLVSSLHAQIPDTTSNNLNEVDQVEVVADEHPDSTVGNVENYEEDEPPDPLYLPMDSIKTYRKRAEYRYMKDLDSLLRNLSVDAVQEKEQPSSSIFEIGIIKLIVWGLAIFGVLFLLYQLFAGQHMIFARNKKLETSLEEDAYDDKLVSPHLLAQQAEARGEYRHAVRFQYANILQLMGEKKLISLLPQKTNDQYLKEVGKKPMGGDFAMLTLQFEYVWYGEFNLDREQYKSVAGGYRKFIETWL